ncbi:MAG TPA: DoxX family protein [Cyclobacteriaceae bacterium]|jgi:thiosulfate dehydrogenase [quinone] large subunit
MENYGYSKFQMIALVGLRLLIGWHFLYEGVVKLLNPNWSSVGYLMGAQGPFAGLFHGIGENATMLGISDFVIIWSMIFIGLALIFGFLLKPAAVIGMFLLALFYLAYPPFPGIEIDAPAEGSYIIVNKNLIELFALMVVMAFPTAQYYGIERFFVKSASVPVTN